MRVQFRKKDENARLHSEKGVLLEGGVIYKRSHPCHSFHVFYFIFYFILNVCEKINL